MKLFQFLCRPVPIYLDIDIGMCGFTHYDILEMRVRQGKLWTKYQGFSDWDIIGPCRRIVYRGQQLK